MDNKKDFNKWRAGKLGYVYFSRISDLIINEPGINGPLFNYLIDIGKNQKQTGRFFGVEIEPYIHTKRKLNNISSKEYKNIAFPTLLVMFDNKNDHGYFKWIKKPAANGRLVFEASKNDLEELNDSSLHNIVAKVRDWYSNQPVDYVSQPL